MSSAFFIYFIYFFFSLRGPCQDGSLPVSFQLVLAGPYLPAANCVREESACVAAPLQKLFRGAALRNGAGGNKNKMPKHGTALRVAGSLAAVGRVLVVPGRLGANPDWSK